MHFSSLQMLLLAVVAIMSTSRSALGQVVTPKTCAAADQGLQFCSNCTAPSKCVTAGSAAVLMTACKTGQACTVLLGKYAVCKPINETSCACGVKPAKCDPYDPHSVFVCLSGGVTAGQQCKTEAVQTGTCIDGKCGTAPPEPTTVSPDVLCTEVEFGLVAMTPQCTTAVFCDNFKNGGTTEPCGVGQYYDVDAVECLPAPPLPCPVTCGTGACYDKGNCSKWYICDAGTVLAEETCEGSTPVFDTILLECVENGTCTTNDGCNFALITTLTSTTSTQTPTPITTTSTPPVTTTSTKTSTTPPTTTTSTKTSTTPPATTTSTKTSTTPPTTTTSTKTSTTPPTTSSSTTSTKTSTTPITSSSTSTASTSTTTTNRPSTCGAANVGLRYPFEGNCKKYISCRLVNTNVYGYVESSCLGTLVFNAKTGYCDTLANVPGCVPPV